MAKAQTQSVLFSVALVCASLVPSLATEASSTVTNEFLTSPKIISLSQCSGESDLDCIESFSVDSSGGTNYQEFRFIGNTPEVNYSDANGNEVSIFSARYANDERTLEVKAELESPKRRIFSDGNGNYSFGSALRVYVENLGSDFQSRVLVKIRTSFLKPQDIQLKAQSPSYLIEEISGGKRWTFSGTQTTLSGYLPPEGTTDFPTWFRQAYDSTNAADFTIPTINFIVHHYAEGPNSTYFFNGCNNGIDQYSVEGFNAPAAGVPLWNSETNSININIAAAHLTVDGTLNQGFYFLELPHEFIICSFGEDARPLITAESVQASVILPDGSSQPAVYQATNNGGILRMSITDFHYSRPTISVAGVCKAPARVVDRLKRCPTPTKKLSSKLQPDFGYQLDPRVYAMYSKYFKKN